MELLRCYLSGILALGAVFLWEQSATAQQVSAKETKENHGTFTLGRTFFRPDYFEKTRNGKAIIANAVNNRESDGANVAFSFLNDSLALGVAYTTGAGADPVSGYYVGEAISSVTGFFRDAFRDTDVQVARLAKPFSDTDTFLQYDDGSWCKIMTGDQLATIEDGDLEPMNRLDIPANAAQQQCRWPDGFYKHSGNATVYYFYSSSDKNPSWYGMGFGDSYCAISTEEDWEYIAESTYGWSAPDYYNIRQGSLNRPKDFADFSRGRTYTGVCTRNARFSASYRGRFPVNSAPRTILFPNHFDTSGHGASLYMKAASNNPLGDVMTSTAAGIIGGHNFSFYGSGSTLASALLDDLTLPQLVKRDDNAATYLKYDSGKICYIQSPKMLSILKADTIEVAVDNSAPSTLVGVEKCNWPDGFYHDVSSGKYYFLFSSKSANPTWYGIAFGDQYCQYSSANAAQLAGFMGADRFNPSNNVHTIPTGAFLTGRSKKSCPRNMAEIALDAPYPPAPVYIPADRYTPVYSAKQVQWESIVGHYMTGLRKAIYDTTENSKLQKIEHMIPSRWDVKTTPLKNVIDVGASWVITKNGQSTEIYQLVEHYEPWDNVQNMAEKELPENWLKEIQYTYEQLKEEQPLRDNIPEDWLTGRQNGEKVSASVFETWATQNNVDVSSIYPKSANQMSDTEKVEAIDGVMGQVVDLNAKYETYSELMAALPTNWFDQAPELGELSQKLQEKGLSEHTPTLESDWWEGRKKPWKKITGPPDAKRIGGTYKEPWLATESGLVYRWNGSFFKHIKLPAGVKAKDVGQGWIISTQNSIYRYNPSSKTFDQIPGIAARIGGTYQESWVCSSDGKVYRWNAKTWEHVPSGYAKDVGHGWAMGSPVKVQNILEFNGRYNNTVWHYYWEDALSAESTVDSNTRTPDFLNLQGGSHFYRYDGVKKTWEMAAKGKTITGIGGNYMAPVILSADGEVERPF